MNDKKFCFILCTNSQLYFDECLKYIERLYVPAGYEIEVLSITDAKSMTSGYNEGMVATDAKYKIYLHQDVFIVYPYFLQSILDIFLSDGKIGMIGMIGVEKIPKDGVMWHNIRCGNLYNGCYAEGRMPLLPYQEYCYRLEHGLWKVEAIDGMVMITSKDIKWREDVFDAWDFYDVSQSLEMLRAGFHVVVPEQKNPWCVHDDGILNLKRYDKYRKLCIEEYKEFLY